MPEPLQIYLHDHFAGSTLATELLDILRRTYPDQKLGQFASEMLDDIRQDQQILRDLIHAIGSAGPDFKDAAAWLAEKASRIKLRHDNPEGLGAFEALETLALGILGKRSLWSALQHLVIADNRLAGLDFEALVRRAEEQFGRVDDFRLRMAHATFANGSVDGSAKNTDLAGGGKPAA
jgi:hypothetical protein